MSDFRVHSNESKNEQFLKKNGERAKSVLWFAGSFGLTPDFLRCKTPGHENVYIKLRYDNIDSKVIREKTLFVLERTVIAGDRPSQNFVKKEKKSY